MTEPLSKRTVLVALDGTIAQYGGWRGLQTIGDPYPGAKEFLEKLRTKFRVVIYTTRTNVEANRAGVPEEYRHQTPDDVADYLRGLVIAYLNKHKLSYDEVFSGQGKPLAKWIIDDRAVSCNPETFKGLAKEEYQTVLSLLGIEDDE